MTSTGPLKERGGKKKTNLVCPGAIEKKKRG